MMEISWTWNAGFRMEDARQYDEQQASADSRARAHTEWHRVVGDDESW